jgi:hypothetical protein
MKEYELFVLPTLRFQVYPQEIEINLSKDIYYEYEKIKIALFQTHIRVKA